MTDAALVLTRVTVRYGAAPVIQDVTLEVKRGERFVLVGASGTGKTTLLRTVAGFVAPDSGTISISGRDVTMVPTERRDAVYLSQSPVLFPHLNVWENIAFPLRVRRVSRSEIQTRVDAAVEAMHLTELASRAPRALSGGQRHRAALARAIVSRPALLLLDEPFAGLDPALKGEIRNAVVEAHSQYDPGLVLVTHDFNDAALLADRIGVVIDGRLAQVATPRELFSRPASLGVSRFLGVTNEIKGRCDGSGNFSSVLGMIPGVATGLASGPAVCAFRASGAKVSPMGSIRGVIARVVIRPEHTTIVVATEGGEIEAAIPGGETPPAVGDRLALEVDPNQASVFSSPG